MPRISPHLIRKAKQYDPLVSRLLPICRTLDSAQAELRWLRQHATQVAERSKRTSSISTNKLLHQYVHRRVAGEPLQYILGSEYFGGLEMKCRAGVLIPRQETASAVTYLVRRLLARYTKTNSDLDSDEGDHGQLPKKLRVLDLCTGSGCIPLLFHSEFFAHPTNTLHSMELSMTAVDLSPTALALAKENLRIQRDACTDSSAQALHALQTTAILQADILSEACSSESIPLPQTDILLSNPPYISPASFRSTTARSVRLFEPRMALVPPAPSPTRSSEPVWPASHCQEDTFYPALLQHASRLGARMFWFEVADLAQAQRVAEMADEQGMWAGVEIWRDWLEGEGEAMGREEEAQGRAEAETLTLLSGRVVRVRGEGLGRSVLAWRGDGALWVG